MKAATAVISANAQVWSIWSDLDNGGFNFPREPAEHADSLALARPSAVRAIRLLGAYSSGAYQNASIGFGNYNAAFVSLKMAEWNGLTAQSNFTWSKALGTGAEAQSSSVLTALDPFNLKEQYGRQAWDRKFIYNVFLVYQPPFFKGQSGILGRVLGGWTFATIFAAGSGIPTQVGTIFWRLPGLRCVRRSWLRRLRHGERGPDWPRSPRSCLQVPGLPQLHRPDRRLPIQLFPNGVAQANNWRNPILGLDTRDGGNGILGGLPYWNMDISIKKNIRVAESINLEFQGVFANVLNHNQWTDNYLGLYNNCGVRRSRIWGRGRAAKHRTGRSRSLLVNQA